MLTQEQTLKTLFSEMPDTSKVWIYQSNRFLTAAEVLTISEKAEAFVSSWESHGSKLKADFALLHDLFLVFTVDEDQHEASGCSIDKSVHFVKEIEKLMSLNFFDRTLIAYFDTNNAISLVSLSQIKAKTESGEINYNTLIFNNLINDLNKLKTNWIIPVGGSWLSRFL